MSKRVLAGLCLTGLCAIASAEQTKGTAVSQETTQSRHHQLHRSPGSVFLDIADGAEATLWKPDLSTMPIQVSKRRVTLPFTGMDNYHAIVASHRNGRLVQTAMRYEYLRGKPSGHSPRKLLAAAKAPLEIVPTPLPREHYRYFSGQEWAFKIRFQNRPLEGETVHLETSNGSRAKGMTDDEGRVVFTLPDDFPDLQEGKRDRRSAEFHIRVAHRADDLEYRTTLSAAYRVNPKHWRSGGWGLAVAGAGFLVGGLVGRRSARNNLSRSSSK